MRLTAAGEIFAAHVRRTLTDIRHVNDQLADQKRLHAAHIAIGSAEFAAINVLPKMMMAFQAEHPGARPNIRISISAIDSEPNLGSSEFYGVFRTTFSGDKIFGANEFAFGPVAWSVTRRAS